MKAKLVSLMIAITVTAAFAKDHPRGIYIALPVEDQNLSTRSAWNDPNVKGVLLRDTWANVNPSYAKFNWSYFYTGLAVAAKYNKPVIMSLALGSEAPNWVYQRFPLDSGFVWIYTSGGGGRMPAPWDVNAKSLRVSVIRAFGQFDSNPLVVAITIWAGGREGTECFFAQSSSDVTALDNLGGESVWQDASQYYITKFRDYFPNTPLYLATGNNYPDAGQSMTNLAQYAFSYSFGLQSNALSATYPSYNRAMGCVEFPHIMIDVATINEVVYQTLAPIKSDNMNGASVSQVISNGELGHAKVIELYPGDPAADPGEQSLVWLNQWVLSQ